MLGADVSGCGVVGGMFAFASCLSCPVSGYWSDRLNRKSLMGISDMYIGIFGHIAGSRHHQFYNPI